MKTKKSELESGIQAKGREYAVLRGWWCIKVETHSMNGVPDFLYLRRGVYIWIEWKKPGEDLRPIQVIRIREMREHGAVVHVCDNLEDAKRILR